MSLRDPRGDGADAYLGYQLDADAGMMVRVFEIMDQLRQILNRVDIVVRRRRNQSHSWRRITDAGNPRIDLVAGKLAAFARLGALGHLDLQLLGVDQIFT